MNLNQNNNSEQLNIKFEINKNIKNIKKKKNKFCRRKIITIQNYRKYLIP